MAESALTCSRDEKRPGRSLVGAFFVLSVGHDEPGSTSRPTTPSPLPLAGGVGGGQPRPHTRDIKRRTPVPSPSGAQASYLITLCEQARIDPPRDDLSKAEASKMIDELKAKLDL
jgi:hypothetical protein